MNDKQQLDREIHLKALQETLWLAMHHAGCLNQTNARDTLLALWQDARRRRRDVLAGDDLVGDRKRLA